jgi:hypothetical protein
MPHVYKPQAQAVQRRLAPPVYKPPVQPVQRQAAPPVYKPQAAQVQRQAAPPVYRPQAAQVQRQAAPPVYKPQAAQVQRQAAPPVYRPRAPQVQRQAPPPVYKPQLAARLNGSPIVQRKIRINGTWYSFENLYDDHGNPFLYSHAGERKRFRRVQDNVRLQTVAPGGEFLTLSKATKQNVYRSLAHGRPMHVKAEGGEKFKLLPFKDYKFGQDTPFDIAVFPEGGEKAPLYPDFDRSMMGGLDDRLEGVTDATNPVLSTVDAVRSQMTPVVWGEDYRTPGAREVFEHIFKEEREGIKDASEKYEKEKPKEKSEDSPPAKRKKRGERDPKAEATKEVTLHIRTMTSKLPFAGEGGKKKFAQRLEQGEWDEFLTPQDKERVVTTGEWFGIRSPMREDEDELSG